jgi:hypothetical protein
MKKIVRLTESDLTRIIKRTIIEMEEDDDEVIVNVNDISKEDMACFNDVATPSGMNGGKYKRKKKGCQTKTRYKSKTKYYGNNRF